MWGRASKPVRASKAREISGTIFRVNPNRIDLNTPLKGPDGPDSLEMVELVMALEEAFDVEIPDDDAEKFSTVGDLVDYIQNRAKPRQARESLLKKIWEVIQQVLGRVRR